MPKYSIYAVIECGKYLGDVEAASEEDALLKGIRIPKVDLSQCHFGASEIKPKIIKRIVRAI